MREVIGTLTVFGRVYVLGGEGDDCNSCAFLRNQRGDPVCVGGEHARRLCKQGGRFIELPGERGSE
jgi:hypothetical protein